MLRIVDEHVGLVRRRIGADVVLAVASDHGLAGVSRSFRPNVALAAAGLLALDAAGEVDLARTRAAYFAGNSGFVTHQPRRRAPAASSRPGEEDALRGEVARVLGEVARSRDRDAPSSSTCWTRARPTSPRMGGPRGGDLYLSLAPGVSLSASPEGAVGAGDARRAAITSPTRSGPRCRPRLRSPDRG